MRGRTNARHAQRETARPTWFRRTRTTESKDSTVKSWEKTMAVTASRSNGWKVTTGHLPLFGLLDGGCEKTNVASSAGSSSLQSANATTTPRVPFTSPSSMEMVLTNMTGAPTFNVTVGSASSSASSLVRRLLSGRVPPSVATYSTDSPVRSASCPSLASRTAARLP